MESIVGRNGLFVFVRTGSAGLIGLGVSCFLRAVRLRVPLLFRVKGSFPTCQKNRHDEA